MSTENDELHGNAPDTCGVALLLIDVINDFEYPGGDQLFAQALPAAQRIAALKATAKPHHIPVVYVNDNFGKWRADRHELVRHGLEDDMRGEPIVRLLAPGEDDYFVLKPKHSGFYATPLDLLLEHLQASWLILVGFAGDNCVLLTASDAFLRDFHLIIPADCVASIDPDENAHALSYAARVFKADTTPSSELDLGVLLEQAGKR
ncbi:MAG TPA: isochorismatase family cysteine hydrolase [Ktedonobacterales bacterium]|jgi:nicotinamidase-related amidase|nr:isochorismatase family cysteine hydrolase [Ktedonobacterales bacterium]